MQNYSFATLVTSVNEPMASHLPFLLDSRRGPFGTLRGHLARANPQWQSFNATSDALVIFQGPHAYISPSWYQNKMNVPTWNYVAIHAYGKPRIIEDKATFRSLLKETVNYYESNFPQPWTIDSLPETFFDKLQQQIVGFEIEITRLQGKFKLNQNRTTADRKGVVAALSNTPDPLSHQIAKFMNQI